MVDAIAIFNTIGIIILPSRFGYSLVKVLNGEEWIPYFVGFIFGLVIIELVGNAIAMEKDGKKRCGILWLILLIFGVSSGNRVRVKSSYIKNTMKEDENDEK